MVNIKCINNKEKIIKISEISKIRKYLEDNRVDIMQEIIQRNWRKGRAFIPAFILILCMCLTGCGSGMYMYYYPIQNPSDETEFTYIPVWEFKTNDDNQGKNPICVLVNAIDGTLVDVVY